MTTKFLELPGSHMNSDDFRLSSEQFDRLFPFYILVNTQFEIVSYGSSLTKLYPECKGRMFTNCFAISRPETKTIDTETFQHICNQLIILQGTNPQSTKLRGQFEFLPEKNQFLFIGSPWFDSMEQVKENGLNLHNFAYHDPLIDLLHVLKTKEIVNEDLKELLVTVNNQKQELKQAAAEIKDIALFPMQNPDPMIRIDAYGNVIMENPAVSHLNDFWYKGNFYSKIEFWRFIAAIGFRKVGRWTLEAVADQKIYSFVISYLAEQCYFNIYGRDITGQKEKEEQLKILSKIAEVNINAVIITDQEGRISWVNKSFTEMSGYELHEIKGTKPGKLLQGPETSAEAAAYLSKQIKNGLPFNTEIVNYAKNGSRYWVRLQGQPIHNDAGELTGFFALEEDITREKEVQQQIKDSELKFKTVLEKISDVVWEHDFRTGKTYFSKAKSEITGLEVTSSLNTEMVWWGDVDDDDLADITKIYKNYKKGTANSHSIEYRVTDKNNQTKWVLDRGVVIEKDIQGVPLRIIGTHTDISHIKQTETALEQRVKQFQTLSENIPGVIYEYVFRRDGSEGLSYISPAMERVFGIKPENFHNYLSYINPEDHARIINKNENSKKTLEPFYDESLLTIPGVGKRWHAVHSSFSYITSTGDIVFTGFMMDITDRKNADAKLRANEEKYQGIIANMNLGLLELDNKGTITFANQSFCTISGYHLDELLGSNAEGLLLTKKGIKILEEKGQQRQNGIGDAFELEIKTKSGALKWCLISGAQRYNEKGELAGSVAIHLDITEQKNLEHELIKARVNAEQLARTKETFLANMSHEIRTPMNAIMGMSNQLAKGSLTAQQQFYLEVIQSASDNLLVIINDILDLSKIEAGKLSLEYIGFEPKLLGIKAMRVLAHKAEEKGIRLTSSFFDPQISHTLIGDPFRLNQVLLNLMSNAIKFTEKGHVDISFRLLEDDDQSQLIKVAVEDTGIGMDKGYIQHLFDKFTQEYESTSRNFGGTGLGMSICKDLVELMGGTISVESKKGVGTIISFIIRSKKGKYTDLPEKQTAKLDADFLIKKKVLIVDDNDMNRLVASIFLENYGAEIINAASGQQGVDEFMAHSPDVILMDIQMPGINGFDATRMIRKVNNKIPIIALTANAIKGESQKCLDAGMNDYVSKPFKEEDLLKTIAKWLGKEVNIINVEEMIPHENEEALYDLSSLRSISRGNNAFIELMVNTFCEQTPPAVHEMKECYNSGNLTRMKALAHKIKPSIDNLHINPLKQTIRDIENFDAEKTGDTNIVDYLNKTDMIITKVVKMMKLEFPGVK